MGSWTVRRAEPNDADALTTCIDAAYAQYAARIPDLPAVAANCAEQIAESQVWVAERAGEIVGGLIIKPQAGFMQLVNVAVHPNQRGTGLGRALLTLAESEARELGLQEMRLTTHVGIPENLRIYEHLGWVEEGRQGNKLRMTKAL